MLLYSLSCHGHGAPFCIARLIVVSINFPKSARIRILKPRLLSPNDGPPSLPERCSTRRRRSRGRCGCRKTPIARQMPLGEHSILTSHLRCRKRTRNGVRRTRLRKPGGLVDKYTPQHPSYTCWGRLQPNSSRELWGRLADNAFLTHPGGILEE